MLKYISYLLLFPTFLFAQVTLNDESENVLLHDYTYEYATNVGDSYVHSLSYDWKNVTGVKFIDHLFSDHSLFKYKVINTSSTDRSFWMSSDLQWEKVTVYCDGKKVGVAGKTVKKTERTIDDNLQLVPLFFEANSETELVLEVQSKINYGTKISLISPEFFLQHSLSKKKTLSFFYGILSMLFVLNLIWFVITKEKLRIAYAFYIFSIAYFSGKADNYMFYVLFPEHTFLLFYEYHLDKLVLAWGFGLYLHTYLGNGIESRKVKRYLLIILGGYTVQYFFELLVSGSNYYYHSLVPVFWLSFFMLLKIREYREKKYLLLTAVFIVCVGVTINISQALNWRSFTNNFTIFATNYSAIIDAVFFAIITAVKMRDDSKETIKLQGQLIGQLKEQEELQQKVNKELEGKVNERTIDLREKNEELNSLNEKLKEQSVEIMNMNEQLDLHNYQLKKENKEILKSSIVGSAITFEKIQHLYPDQLSCLQYLKKLKWEEGYTCRKCEGEKHNDLDAHKGKRCSRCGAVEAITANTLFERLRIPLEKAFYIAYTVLTERENVKH